MKKTTLLRKLIAENDILVSAGGSYDCMSAKLVEKAGFKVTTLTGSGIQASLLGMPDVGLITMTEVVTHARNIASSVHIPVLTDTEQGFGGIINLQRTVREMEKAGIAGMSIQDETYPKLATGNNIISIEEMVLRIKAALASREDPDFVICARTESSRISFDELIRRCNAYALAGADFVKPILPRPRDLNAFKALANGVKSPMWFSVEPMSEICLDDLRNLGIRGIATYLGGPSLMIPALRAMKSLLMEVKNEKNGARVIETLAPINSSDLEELTGLPDLVEFEHRFMKKEKY